MSDLDLGINIKLNTPEVKADAKGARESVRAVNEEAKKGNDNYKVQEGLLERLKRRMQELNTEKLKASDTKSIEKYNIKIQQFQKEIERLNRIGKQGFDDMGKAIPNFDKPRGQIERMGYLMKLYSKAAKEAMSVELIEKYNRKLQETQEELKRLNDIGKEGKPESGSSSNDLEKAGDSIGAVFSKVASVFAISFSLDQLKQWGQELFEIANKASGIERAFSSLGDSQALAKLRRETDGFVSDLDLQSLTVQAKNLNVPIENLGTYLAFAAQRAKDTGKEVNALVDDIINGLGRESARIIDNLGISQKELNKEIAKTGDFAQAVANIMTRSMNEAGVAVDTLADKTNRLASWWENLKLKASGWIAGWLDGTLADNKVIGNLTSGAMKSFSDFDKRTSEQREKSISTMVGHIQKLSNAYVKAQQLVKDFGTGKQAYNSGKEVQQALDNAKSLGEKLAASQNVLRNLKEMNGQRLIKDRHAAGNFNINELEEKMEGLSLKMKNSLDPKERSNLKKQIDEVQKLLDQMNGKVDKKAITVDNTFLREKKSLEQKIADINSDYARKSMTQNEAELQAVRDKFEKISKEVDAFNKNPKNKYHVDGSGLDKTRDAAIDDLKYRQQSERIKIHNEEQKRLYNEFEEYKETFGEAKAKERFGKLINVETTYLQQLQTAYALMYAEGVLKGFNGALKERMMAQAKAIKAESESEQRKNDQTLKDFQSYSEQRILLQEKYVKKAEEFRRNQQNTQADEAIRRGVEEVNQLDEVNLQKWTSYKRLFNNVEKMTREQTLVAIANFEKELMAFVGSNELKKKYLKQIKDLKKSIKDDDGQALESVVNQLGIIANQFGAINDNIGNVASVLLSSARAYVDIKKGMQDIKNPDSTTTEKIGAGLGIVGAAMSVASSVVGYFKGLKAAKEAAKKAMADFQQAAKLGELEYQELLRKRELDEVKRGKSSYQAIIAQLELLKKQSPKIKAEYDKIFASLQGQSSVAGIGYQHGTWLRKAKTWDIMASLFGSNYDDLEKLYTENKLKDAAKADFEALRALREELKAAGVDVADLQLQLNEMLTGTSVGGLSDSLTELFENLKFSTADLGKSFEDILRNGIIQSFKVKFLQEQMQPWFEEFGALMQSSTPDKQQIEDLRKKFEEIGLKGGEYWKQLESMFGIKLSNPASTPTASSAVGGIRAELTEETGGKIEGLARNSIELQKQSIALQKEGMAIKREQLMYDKQIEANTANIAVSNNKALEYLSNIKLELGYIKDNTAVKYTPKP